MRAAATKGSIHGELLIIEQCGVLITGDPAMGKSELALSLVANGHKLVVDDGVLLRKLDDGRILGYCAPILHGHLEVYGLGIIDIVDRFGCAAVAKESAIDLVIALCQHLPSKDMYPLTIQQDTQELLGATVPKYLMPSRSYHNPAQIVELMVYQFKRQQQSIHNEALSTPCQPRVTRTDHDR